MSLLTPNNKLLIVPVSFFDYIRETWIPFDKWIISNPSEPQWDSDGFSESVSSVAETKSPITGMTVVVSVKIDFIKGETEEQLQARIEETPWVQYVDIDTIKELKQLQSVKEKLIKAKEIHKKLREIGTRIENLNELAGKTE